MRVNEVAETYTSNEEHTVLDKMTGAEMIESYTEREQFIIENLIRKSLVTKFQYNNSYLVVKNENN
jgi:hypothetical protein